MNPWDSLPNGKRIDEVLEFTKHNLGAAWMASRYVGWDTERITAWADARHAAWRAAFDGGRRVVWELTKDVIRNVVWDPLLDKIRDTTGDAVSALIAYDYAGELYDADLDVVELAAHAGDPAAVLMLPMLRVMRHTKEKS